MSEIIDNRPQFYWVEHDLLKTYGARMGAYGIAVYNALAYYANNANEAWPGAGTIARMIGCSERQVRATLQLLKELGVIDITPRFNEDGKRTSNAYTLHRVQVHPAQFAEELESVELRKKTGLTPLPNGGLEY